MAAAAEADPFVAAAEPRHSVERRTAAEAVEAGWRRPHQTVGVLADQIELEDGFGSGQSLALTAAAGDSPGLER